MYFHPDVYIQKTVIQQISYSLIKKVFTGNIIALTLLFLFQNITI